MGLIDRLKRSWDVFRTNKDPTNYDGPASYFRPDRVRLRYGNERSIVTPVYNRMALDVSQFTIQHAMLDTKKDNRYLGPKNSTLNECLTLSANLDQTSRAFLQDAALSLFDEGSIAIVPVLTDDDPDDVNSYDILELRVAKIVEWFPKKVKVECYNENKGRTEQITLSKDFVSIVENPYYAVMNEPSSIAKRLMRKLALLDYIDEKSGSGKLDLIIQLPYSIKTKAKQTQSEMRRADIENQIANSKLGIAYIDSTEKITQLNRSLDNNLLEQIRDLEGQLYSHLGITPEIMNGTADENTMNNYLTRTIEPVLAAIVDEMKRKFLTKTARTQGQSIVYFNNPFKLIPTTALAELTDKLTRNEIMSSNEIRQVMGLKPVDNEQADELRNKNLNPGEGQEFANTNEEKETN